MVQHAFTAAGQFLIKLTVTDSLGTRNTSTLQVVISEPAPLAVCTVTPSTATVGEPVTFSGAQSVAPVGSSLVSFIYDFGDGVTNVPGTLPGGTTFDGVSGLRTALLSRPEPFVGTLTEKLLTYALGRGVTYSDAPAVRQIRRAAAADDYRFTSLVAAIAESAPFQMRRTGQ